MNTKLHTLIKWHIMVLCVTFNYFFLTLLVNYNMRNDHRSTDHSIPTPLEVSIAPNMLSLLQTVCSSTHDSFVNSFWYAIGLCMAFKKSCCVCRILVIVFIHSCSCSVVCVVNMKLSSCRCGSVDRTMKRFSDISSMAILFTWRR